MFTKRKTNSLHFSHTILSRLQKASFESIVLYLI